jgi:hypothetical protein
MIRSSIFAAALAVVCVASAQADVLYSSGLQGLTGGPGAGTVTGIVGPITGGPNFNKGFGDDYVTTAGTGTVTMTSFIFAGGVSVANGALGFEFYNPDGSDAGTGFAVQLPSNSTSIWTITLNTPVIIPAAGYCVMQPVVAGIFSGVPGSTGKFGVADIVDVGSNNPSITASVNDADVLTTGAFITSQTNQYLAFEIQGPAVPEPTSAGLLAVGALALGRRRR